MATLKSQGYRPSSTTIRWLVHWLLMGGLLHLVQRGRAYVPSPLLAVPNVKALPSTASVPTAYIIWCGIIIASEFQRVCCCCQCLLLCSRYSSAQWPAMYLCWWSVLKVLSAKSPLSGELWTGLHVVLANCDQILLWVTADISAHYLVLSFHYLD